MNDTQKLTDAQRKRAEFVEFRRGIIALLRYGVMTYGVSYADLLPSEITATPAPEYAAPTSTPIPSFTR
jgi:hypothetical protein